MRPKLRSGSAKIQIWVDPGFRELLKDQAKELKTDVLALTERLAKKQDDEEIFKPLTKFFRRIL